MKTTIVCERLAWHWTHYLPTVYSKSAKVGRGAHVEIGIAFLHWKLAVLFYSLRGR